MTAEITLFYHREAPDVLSTGRIESTEMGLVTEEDSFTRLEFRDMLKRLCDVLTRWPAEEELRVVFQRTDRARLVPYRLDPQTVALFRTDPVAAIASMTTAYQSPSTTEKRVKEERDPTPAPVIRAGYDTLADAFGDVLFFRVKNNTLECPGCGFWGAWTILGLLNDPERVGEEFKTIFACRAKCLKHLAVSCRERWGYIRTEYLLENTNLDRFYFPRGWNDFRPWVSRDELRALLAKYKHEKEQIQ